MAVIRAVAEPDPVRVAGCGACPGGYGEITLTIGLIDWIIERVCGRDDSAPAAAPAAPVDMVAKLDALAATADQPLDWRHSIVDLMKLIGMDSSLANREKLAEQLGFTDATDTDQMNIWLHKQVMQRLAANGGNVPAELL